MKLAVKYTTFDKYMGFIHSFMSTVQYIAIILCTKFWMASLQ